MTINTQGSDLQPGEKKKKGVVSSIGRGLAHMFGYNLKGDPEDVTFVDTAKATFMSSGGSLITGETSTNVTIRYQETPAVIRAKAEAQRILQEGLTAADDAASAASLDE